MNRAGRIVLRMAARLVPRERRADWLAEWESEACYLAQCRRWTVFRFCLGAIPDAVWLRRNSPGSPARQTSLLRSPVHCLLLLAVLTAASIFLALRLPATRDLLMRSPYPNPDNLFLVARVGSFADTPSVSVSDYQAITSRMSAAFYRMQIAEVSRGRQSARLAVVEASANLFEVLGQPIRATGAALVLRRRACRKYFDDCRRMIGTMVEAAGRRVPVAAVLEDRFWTLPGRADAWLIEGPAPASPTGYAKGIVVGRAPGRPSTGVWDLIVPNTEGGSSRFACIPVEQMLRLWPHVLMLAIALLILPTFTSLEVGHFPANEFPWRCRTFLTAKLALLLPLVAFASLDLCSLVSIGLQAPCLLAGYIAAFRWALVDQRRRCPVCLQALGNPTGIGWASQVLLELYGTELICGEGHGLMQVPEIPSSSSNSRWLTFEQSWSSLFSASR